MKLGTMGVEKKGGKEEAERNEERKKGCTAFYEENLDLFLQRIRCLGGFLLFFFFAFFLMSLCFFF